MELIDYELAGAADDALNAAAHTSPGHHGCRSVTPVSVRDAPACKEVRAPYCLSIPSFVPFRP